MSRNVLFIDNFDSFTFNLVESIDPEARGMGSSSRMAVSLGLALKGAGVDALGMDFRQDEFQYTKKFEAVKTTMLVTVELIIVFLAAIALHFYFKKKDLEVALKSVYSYHQQMYENVTGETITDSSQAYTKFNELYQQAIRSSGQDLPLMASAREACRDLFNAIQKFQQKHGDKTLSDGTLFLDIDSLDIQQSTTPGNESVTMMLRGKIRNLEFLGLLKNEIRSVDLFANVDVQGQTPMVNDLYQFTLKATKGKKS